MIGLIQGKLEVLYSVIPEVIKVNFENFRFQLDSNKIRFLGTQFFFGISRLVDADFYNSAKPVTAQVGAARTV